MIARIMLGQPAVQITLGAGILVFASLASAWARGSGWSTPRIATAGVAGACFALVPATTLARGDVLLAWDRSCLVTLDLSLGSSAEAVLNTLLFVPAVFAGALALLRATPVMLAAVACTVAIEAVQLVTGLGTCQTVDMFRNVAGAVAAAAVAAVLLWLRALARGGRAHRRELVG